MSFESLPFGELFACPQKNGLTRPKRVRGTGLPMVNMGELFAHPRIGQVKMDLVPVSATEGSFLLEPGDLLFARQSLVRDGAGQCSIFLGNALPTVFESHLIRCRLATTRADPDFYFYFFRSPQGRMAIEAIIEQGAGAAGIRGSDLVRLRVPLPPLPHQRWVASALRAIDDRIDLLRQTNATLESIAQALFQSWFIDFDPVRAKAEGREPEGMDAATAAVFPAAFVESALGLLPQGWQIGSILDRALLLSGGTPRTDREEYWGGPILWASAKDVSQSTDTPLLRTERTITALGLAESATRIIPTMATVIVARGATTGRMVLVGREMAMNQTCYALVSKCSTPAALYCLLQREVPALLNAAHGSVFDTITTSTFAQSKVIHPPQEVTERFENAVRPLFERIVNGTLAAHALAELRDTLLPRLISGKLRLPEAQAQLEEAIA